MQPDRKKTLILLAAFALIALVVCGVRYSEARSSPQERFSDASDFRYRVDLNNSGEDELLLLPGVGRARANAIIERRAVRPFTRLEELKDVRYAGGRPVFDGTAVMTLKDHVTISAPRPPRAAGGMP